MDPKICFLFVLFITIVIGASPGNLRDYARKLRFVRLSRGALRSKPNL